MAAKGLPQGKELDLLQDVKDNVPSKVFSTPYVLPTHNDHMQTRKNLRRAVELLRYAGYDFVDGKMTHIASNKPLEIEVLGNAANGSSFTRVMLPFIENLKKIGIKTTFRNLEVNVFKNRLDNFDFEVAILSIRMSNLPSNELKEVFGSGSADIKGSYNYMGIKNQAVDKLIDTIISAQQKEEYIAAIKALDRVLLHEHYLIPQWYSPHNRIAYHKGLKHLQTDFPAGFNIYTWWREQQQ